MGDHPGSSYHQISIFTTTSQQQQKKKKETPKNSKTLPDNSITMKMTMKMIIFASSKIILAVQKVIKFTYVIIRHGMDTKHFVYPKPIPIRCDSIPKIIAARALVSVLLKFKKKNEKRKTKT